MTRAHVCAQGGCRSSTWVVPNLAGAKAGGLLAAAVQRNAGLTVLDCSANDLGRTVEYVCVQLR